MLDVDVKAREAIARSAVYKALSLGFSPPTKEVSVFIGERLPRQLEKALGFLPAGYELGEAVALFGKAVKELDGWEGEHNRLFRVGLVATPYETEHDPMKALRKGQVLADILGFYTAFGLKPSERLKELPDHIAVELEFMSLLLLKEAYARLEGWEEQVNLCVDAEGKFLRDHLGWWAFRFSDQVEKSAKVPLYPALSQLLGRFLRFELQHLGVEPLKADEGIGGEAAIRGWWNRSRSGEGCRAEGGNDEAFTCPFSI